VLSVAEPFLGCLHCLLMQNLLGIPKERPPTVVLFDQHPLRLASSAFRLEQHPVVRWLFFSVEP
jgi:hypothetical protein